MSVLSDGHIKDSVLSGEIKIDPYDKEMVQPASYDVHLGSSFVSYDRTDSRLIIDPLTTGPWGERVQHPDGIIISPQCFLLATTLEYIELSRCLVARVEGVSSLGRLGLAVHSTAGYIDPGFSGEITLELFNMAPYSIVLTPGMRIAQLAFERLSGPSQGYKGRYQRQRGATPSKYGRKDIQVSEAYL